MFVNVRLIEREGRKKGRLVVAARRSAQSCVNVTDSRLKKKKERKKRGRLIQLWILSWWLVGGEEMGGEGGWGRRGGGLISVPPML